VTPAEAIEAVRAHLATAEQALRAADRMLTSTHHLTVRVLDPQIRAALAAVDIAAVVTAGDAARLALHDDEE
jgi:hypothetical protein